jgi:glutathione synthase/RimK-type ligase-like ATP-grasp enzyme
MRLTGIFRDTLFSPFQHAENDRLILEMTAAALKNRGFAIDWLKETDVGETPLRASAVFSMCQGPRANAWLEGLEGRGTLVINSPRAVKNCYRAALYRPGSVWLPHFPRTVVIDIAAGVPELSFADGDLWLKRGDVHATQHGDVVRVKSQAQLSAVLTDFVARDISMAAVQQHVEGKVVKFYGVIGTPFFACYAEQDRSESPPEVHAARPMLEQIMRMVGLDIYGGDVVLDPSGGIQVIDVNDWPSFASFRAAAAEAIAQRIAERVRRFPALAEQYARMTSEREPAS